ncbi:hypothetical protein L603_000100001560 [Cellulosimicrobium cellulans J34]|nr:hypothetical protein L603_000100001560 [Cellulosimicrobium cellulans J34]SME95724.1 hypothetical protein SAMN02744115_00553 [Cellulosimicrobium cellulans J1]
MTRDGPTTGAVAEPTRQGPDRDIAVRAFGSLGERVGDEP